MLSTLHTAFCPAAVRLATSLALTLSLVPLAWAQVPTIQGHTSTPLTAHALEHAQSEPAADGLPALARWAAITAHTAARGAGAARLASYVRERSEGGDFENTGEATFTYDAQGRLVGTIDEFEFLFFPRRTLRVTRAYNADGTWASSTIDELENDVYAPYRRELYAYEDGRLVSATEELYESGAYGPTQRTTFVYSDDYPFPTEYVTESFEEGTPIVVGKTTLTEEDGDVYRTYEDLFDDDFDSSNREIFSSVALEDFGASYAAAAAPGTPWTSVSKFLALYFASYTEQINPNPPYPQSLLQRREGEEWVDDVRRTMTRSDGLVVESLRERFDSNTGLWMNESHSQLDYDAEGHVISNTISDWFDGAWVSFVVASLTYDANGNVEEYLEEVYDSGAVTTTYRSTYSWEGTAVSAESGAPARVATLALAGPNPFAGRTALRLSLGETAEAEVHVYDVLGRRVATLHEGALAAGDHVVPFEAGGLAGGLYVVRASTGAWATTRTLTLVR